MPYATTPKNGKHKPGMGLAVAEPKRARQGLGRRGAEGTAGFLLATAHILAGHNPPGRCLATSYMLAAVCFQCVMGCDVWFPYGLERNKSLRMDCVRGTPPHPMHPGGAYIPTRPDFDTSVPNKK